MTKPFLKWVGGKRQLLDKITPLIPHHTTRLIEPFMGGAAVFFGTSFPSAILNDINPELTNCYHILKAQPDALIENLQHFQYDKEMFLEVRSWDRQEDWPQGFTDVARAARFIYLNRTGFNGMFRVNAKGQFNVPFGRYVNPKICDAETLLQASANLQKAEITHADFEDVLENCTQADFVYLDPPYIPISSSSNFTSYAHDGFNMEAQVRLADAVHKIARRNISFVLSNSYCVEVEKLYEPFHFIEVQAGRAINAQATGRGAVKEYIITNQ